MVLRGLNIIFISRALMLVAAIFLLNGCSWIFGKEEQKETVEDVRYGVALYHFFQEKYFDALTELYVGEKLLDMQQHQETGRLLRGGISLSYGMENVAEPIFKELLDKNRQGLQRDRAWFYLAKIQYKNNNMADAVETLNRVGENLDETEFEESLYMRANIELANNRFSEAEEIIDQLSDDSIWLPYYQYNRGSSLARQGEWREAVGAFDQVRLNEINREKTYLFDKSRIAAGYAAISGEFYVAAVNRFKQVGKDSPFVTQALLGYGWAEANQGNFELALSPWQYLNSLSKLDPAVQESFLAIPYIYEKIDAKTESLKFYKKSVVTLESELQAIDTAISRYKSEPIDILFFTDNDTSIDRFGAKGFSLVDDQQLYLSHLIAKEGFQKGLLIYSELNKLRSVVSGNITRTLVIDQVYQDQQNAWEQLISQNKHLALKDEFNVAIGQRDNSINRFNQAIDNNEYASFDSPKRYKVWQRIKGAEQKIKILRKANIPVNDELAKLETLKGILLWVAEDEKITRKVTFNNAIKQLNIVVEEVDDRFERILLAIDGQRGSPLFGDIADMKGRLNIGYETVDSLLVRSEDYLRQLAIKELDSQKNNLVGYVAHAKLAIARLYDEGSTRSVE